MPWYERAHRESVWVWGQNFSFSEKEKAKKLKAPNEKYNSPSCNTCARGVSMVKVSRKVLAAVVLSV